MSSCRRSYVNNPDMFCCICGEYTFKKKTEKLLVTFFVKRAYLGYLGVRLRCQDKTWAQHEVSKTCIEHLQQWSNGKRNCLKFSVPETPKITSMIVICV